MRDLTAVELARLRATQVTALPDTCTIQTATETKDAVGQVVRTWAAAAEDVACRLAQLRADERQAGERTSAVTEWVLTVAHDQAITTGQRVVVDTRTFEVVGVNTAESWETATRARLVEVV